MGHAKENGPQKSYLIIGAGLLQLVLLWWLAV
jgi:hypothetical protein